MIELFPAHNYQRAHERSLTRRDGFSSWSEDRKNIDQNPLIYVPPPCRPLFVA